MSLIAPSDAAGPWPTLGVVRPQRLWLQAATTQILSCSDTSGLLGRKQPKRIWAASFMESGSPQIVVILGLELGWSRRVLPGLYIGTV